MVHIHDAVLGLCNSVRRPCCRRNIIRRASHFLVREASKLEVSCSCLLESKFPERSLSGLLNELRGGFVTLGVGSRARQFACMFQKNCNTFQTMQVHLYCQIYLIFPNVYQIVKRKFCSNYHQNTFKLKRSLDECFLSSLTYNVWSFR